MVFGVYCVRSAFVALRFGRPLVCSRLGFGRLVVLFLSFFLRGRWTSIVVVVGIGIVLQRGRKRKTQTPSNQVFLFVCFVVASSTVHTLYLLC